MFSPTEYRIPEIAAANRSLQRVHMQNRSERDSDTIRKIRTVIVDDCEVLLQKLRQALETIGRVEIVGHASDGKQALNITRELKPDLVVMDVNMPVMDGLEAAQLMEANFPETFVILTSAFDHLHAYRLPQLQSVEFASKSQLCDALPGLLTRLFPDHK